MSADHYIASEHTFRWATVTVGAVFAVIVATIGSCVAYESALIDKMVAAGAEPMRASCAIRPSNPDCRTVAALTGRDAK